MFPKMMRNFLWNCYDNMLPVLGFSLIGTMLNLPLIFGAVLFSGTMKLDPGKLLFSSAGPRSVREAEALPMRDSAGADRDRKDASKDSGKDDTSSTAEDAKVFPAGLPRVTVQSNTLRISVRLNGEGSVYYVVSTNPEARPDTDRIVAHSYPGMIAYGDEAVGSERVEGISVDDLPVDRDYALLLAANIPEKGMSSRGFLVRQYIFSSSEAVDLLFSIMYALLLSFSFPVMASVYGAARKYIDRSKQGFFKSLVSSTRENFMRGLGLFLINALVYGMFFIAFKFYRFAPFFDNFVWLQYIGIFINALLMVFYTFMQIYLLPLLVHRKESLPVVFRKAALLVFDNIIQTFMVFLLTASIFVLTVMFHVLIASLLLPGLLAMLHVTNYFVLLRRYEPPEDEASSEFIEENDARNWKTIFRPWEQ